MDRPPTPPVDGLDVERLDMLRDLDDDGTSYLDRAIDNFEVNSVEAVDAVLAAVAAGDAEAARTRVHKIAGSALNLGAPRAGRAAQAVEVAIVEDGLDAARALLDELDAAMTEARELLRRYRATYAGPGGLDH